MANFFSGLGGPLLTQAAQGLGAYNQGQQQENEQRVANSLKLLALKREADKDALAHALGQAHIRDLDAQSQQRALDPVDWIRGGDGQWYQVPKRQPRDPNAITGIGGIGGIGGNAGGRANDAGAQRDPMAAPAPYSPLALFSSPQQAAARGTGGIASGIPTPQPLKPLPRVIRGQGGYMQVGAGGIASPLRDSTGAQVALPPSGRGTNPNDAELTHSLVNLRQQIGQTTTQLHDAQRRAKAGSGLLADDATRQQAANATAQATALQQRLDSLTGVHDRLSAQQQRGLSPASTATPSVASPARGASGLRPEDAAAMQAEFDDASRSLQTILNAPNATPVDKAQARQLYDQQQRVVAQKYRQRVTRP